MMGRSIVSTIILLYAFSAFAEGGYTNHAGNVVAGWPVKLTATHVVLSECDTNHQSLTTNHYPLTTIYPLSIFQNRSSGASRRTLSWAIPKWEPPRCACL